MDVTNEGTFTQTTFSNASGGFVGDFVNETGATLNLALSYYWSWMNFRSGLVNDGDVVMTSGTGGSELVLNARDADTINQTITNTGTLWSKSGTATHWIYGDIDNQVGGLIDIDKQLIHSGDLTNAGILDIAAGLSGDAYYTYGDVTNSGSISIGAGSQARFYDTDLVDNTGGNLFVGSGATLILAKSAGVTNLGSTGNVSGNGQISFTGYNGVLNLDGDWTTGVVDEPTLNFGNGARTLIHSGADDVVANYDTFTNAAGVVMNVSADIFYMDFVNAGTLNTAGQFQAANAFKGTFENQLGGTVNIVRVAYADWTTFENGIVNAGDIVMTSGSGGSALVLNARDGGNVLQTITNTGTIWSQSGTATHWIYGDIDNQVGGLIDIDKQLIHTGDLTNAGSFDIAADLSGNAYYVYGDVTNTGSISIGANSTARFYDTDTFDNTAGNLFVDAGATLAIDTGSSVTNLGGTGNLSGGGQITFNGYNGVVYLDSDWTNGAIDEPSLEFGNGARTYVRSGNDDLPVNFDTFTNASGHTMGLAADIVQMDFVNAGTVNANGQFQAATVFAGGFENQFGATFNLTQGYADSSVSFQTGIVNAGTITLTSAVYGGLYNGNIVLNARDGGNVVQAITNTGTIWSVDSPGTHSIYGDLDNQAGALLDIDKTLTLSIGDFSSSGTIDVETDAWIYFASASSTISLDGTLSVTTVGTPTAGDNHTLQNYATTTWDGNFDHITGLDLGGGLVFDTNDYTADGTVVVTAKAITVGGDANANALSGTGAADVIHGYGDNDTIDTLGLADLAYGGLGDDSFEISDTSFGRIDGGEGFDSLVVNAASLDVTGLRGDQLEALEAIDLGASDAVGRTLTIDDILIGAATDGDDLLIIEGDDLDSVDLGSSGVPGDWSTSGGDFYTTYTHTSGVMAEIDNDIDVTLV